MRSKTYSEQEKIAYVEDFKSSGMTIPNFCRDMDIPETTLRDWLKANKEMKFGQIDLKPSNAEMPKPLVKQPIIFVGENIRIELKEGFNKQFLRKIVEVLINDI